jgi:NADH-quinone oxidoreductase subunit J
MVLFLFVIMLLGAERFKAEEALPWQKPLAFGLTLILVVEAGYIVFFKNGVLEKVTEAIKDFGSPEQVGSLLFNEYLLPFEVTSILLLAAMIGAIVITKTEKKTQGEEKSKES